MAGHDKRQLTLIAFGYTTALAAMPLLSAPFVLPLITTMLPTAAAVNYVIFDRLCRRRNGQAEPAAAAAVKEIGFRVSLFEISLQLLIVATLAGLFGRESLAPARLVLVFFGVLVIGIGDLLPRTRPNLAVGIRTARTLESRDAWIAIHRVAGTAAVALGAVIVLAGTFLTNPRMPQVISVAAWTTLTILFAAYRRHSRRGA
jgi:hypothetical protein